MSGTKSAIMVYVDFDFELFAIPEEREVMQASKRVVGRRNSLDTEKQTQADNKIMTFEKMMDTAKVEVGKDGTFCMSF
jgi:hypothetical protein